MIFSPRSRSSSLRSTRTGASEHGASVVSALCLTPVVYLNYCTIGRLRARAARSEAKFVQMRVKW